jgi:hypothetical protein
MAHQVWHARGIVAQPGTQLNLVKIIIIIIIGSQSIMATVLFNRKQILTYLLTFRKTK